MGSNALVSGGLPDACWATLILYSSGVPGLGETVSCAPYAYVLSCTGPSSTGVPAATTAGETFGVYC